MAHISQHKPMPLDKLYGPVENNTQNVRRCFSTESRRNVSPTEKLAFIKKTFDTKPAAHGF